MNHLFAGPSAGHHSNFQYALLEKLWQLGYNSSPTPFVILFFPHTFFQVALWSCEHKDNVWPGVSSGGCMVYLLLEKEYCKWDDRSMDRLPVPWNNPETDVKRKKMINCSRKYSQDFQVLGLRSNEGTIKAAWIGAGNSEWQLLFSLDVCHESSRKIFSLRAV